MVIDELKERMDEHRVAYYEKHREELSRSDLFNFTAKLFFGMPLTADELEVLRLWTDIAGVDAVDLVDDDGEVVGEAVVAIGGTGDVRHAYGEGKLVERSTDDRGRVRLGTDMADADVLAFSFKRPDDAA